ncbi:hypothetical protein ACWD0J_14870 [Streptomyces sp. NPDC003011]
MLKQNRHAVRGLPAAVEGLEHVPARGPLVVLAGGDGQRPLDTVLFAVRGTPARRLDGPDALRALAHDQAVLVRGVEAAVSAGDRASAPVLPVALWPDGRRTRIAVGPVLPQDTVEYSARDRVRAGHAALTTLVERARNPEWSAGPCSARAAAGHLDRVFEALLSRTDPLPDSTLYAQAALLLGLGRLGDPHNIDLRVGRLRLTALRNESRPLPVKAAALWRLRAGAEEALRRQPDHLMANYLLGRWHLSAPGLLGGRRDLAVAHLEAADRLGRGDTRYVLGHAEALLAADRPTAALSALERVIEAPADHPRTQRRRQSAIRLSRALHQEQAPGRSVAPGARGKG